MPRLTCLVPLLLLAACGPIVQIGGDTKAPDALLTIRADDRIAPAPARSTTLRLSGLPTPGELRTLRLPVTTRDTEVQYLVGANWVEQPDRLFQRLLADVVAQRTGMIVTDAHSARMAPDRELSGRLVGFGLDVRGDAPVVRVRYDALLTAKGTAAKARRFDVTEPVASDSPTTVAAALNTAANRAAAAIADWAGATDAQ